MANIQMKRFATGVSAAIFTLGLAGCIGLAETAPQSSSVPILADVSDAASTVLENEWVRVTRVSLEPGQSLPTHSVAQRVIYALSDYEVAWREGDEPEIRRRWAAGNIHVYQAGDHSLTNIGDSEASFLVVERLSGYLPASAGAEVADAAVMSPATTELLLETDIFRVLRVELSPEQSQPMHGGRPRVIYALTDYKIEWREDGEAPKTRSWTQGDAHWHLSGDHAARNIGGTTASWLIVSLKN